MTGYFMHCFGIAWRGYWKTGFNNINSQIGQLTAVETGFDLSGNQVSGSLPSQMGSFTALAANLNLDGNQLVSSIPCSSVNSRRWRVVSLWAITRSPAPSHANSAACRC